MSRSTESHRERGSSYIEFLLVAPIFLLIAASTIEIARFLRFRQLAGVFSKEAALEAYRKCDITNITTTGGNSDPSVDWPSTSRDISSCLQTLETQMNAGLTAAGFPSSRAKVILSMYRWNYSQLVPSSTCSTTASDNTGISSSSTTSSSADSAFQLTSGSVQSKTAPRTVLVTRQMGCQTGRVVVGEVAFFYSPIITFRVIGQRFDVNFNDTKLKKDSSNATFSTAYRETTIL